MDDLVSIGQFDNSMEAELAKNALESMGVFASLALDEKAGSGKIKLLVRAEDLKTAEAFLNSESDCQSPEDTSEAVRAEAANEEARKEFEAIHLEEMRHKAAGVRKSFIILCCALTTGLLIFLIGSRSPLMNRLALGCLLYAVIELFIGLDALKAAKSLKNIESSRPDRP